MCAVVCPINVCEFECVCCFGAFFRLIYFIWEGTMNSRFFINNVRALFFNLCYHLIIWQRLMEFISLLLVYVLSSHWIEICQNQMNNFNYHYNSNKKIVFLSNGLFNCFNALSRTKNGYTQQKLFASFHNYVWPWAIIDFCVRWLGQKHIWLQYAHVLDVVLFFVRLIRSLCKRANNLMNYFWFSICLWVVVCFCFFFVCAGFSVDRRRA